MAKEMNTSVKKFNLRQAILADSADILSLRNDPTIISMFRIQKPIPEDEHRKWLNDVLVSDTTILFLAFKPRAKRAIASVRFDVIEQDIAEVSIILHRNIRGANFARPILMTAIEQFSLSRFGINTLRAIVRKSNFASKRLFTAAQFKPKHESLEFITFERHNLRK